MPSSRARSATSGDMASTRRLMAVPRLPDDCPRLAPSIGVRRTCRSDHHAEGAIRREAFANLWITRLDGQAVESALREELPGDDREDDEPADGEGREEQDLAEPADERRTATEHKGL